jgi:hypothetical protein
MKEIQTLYFIQQGDNGPIKIGVSTNPYQRLRALQVGSPQKLHLLKVIEAEEIEVHKTFQHLRLHGEWFRPKEDLLQFIQMSQEVEGFTPFTETPSFEEVREEVQEEVQEEEYYEESIDDLLPAEIPLEEEGISILTDEEFCHCSNCDWIGEKPIIDSFPNKNEFDEIARCPQCFSSFLSVPKGYFNLRSHPKKRLLENKLEKKPFNPEVRIRWIPFKSKIQQNQSYDLWINSFLKQDISKEEKR